MLNIAHRGFKSKYPENTMLAFKKAIEIGSDGIEFDVHMSKDGIPMIIHDERVDRTTGELGRVKDFTSSELSKMNAASLYTYIDFQGIPTLEEYLAFVKDKDIVTNIELKNSIYEYEGIEDATYKLIEKHDLKNKVIISSFNHKSILKMKEIDQEIKCGLLVASCLVDPWEYVKYVGADYYHPSAYCMDKDTVEQLQKHGIGVNIWFGTEPYDFKKIIDTKCCGIITDYPDKIIELINN